MATNRRSRHGFAALKARVMVRGLAAIDRRTAAAQALLSWKTDLERDLGGSESISAQKAALIELATRTRLLIEHCDHFILSQESLVNRRRRALYPIVRERQALVDSLARLLSQIGLDRQAKPVKELHAYIAEKEKPA